MASPTDLRDSKSLSPPSYGESVNINEDYQAMDSIVVESGPLSPLPPPDGLSPPPLGQEDTFMRTPTDDDDDDVDDVESVSDDGGAGDDEEDEDESLEATALQTEYIVPLKEPEEDHDSTKDMSENSLSVNGTSTAKIEFGESLTRGGKLRKLAPPPPLKRRKTPIGRSRTPRAPSPVVPPRNTSPWPDIQDSDIRNDDDDRDAKRRKTSTRQETNGTKESTPPQATSQRGSRRQGKEDSMLSAEERLKRSKRVKISPRKEKQQPNRQRSPPHPLTAALVRDEAVSGTATPRFIINMKGTEKEDSDPTRYNEEICGACAGPGRFLCCEGCPKSFHFTCLDPPIDENDLPEDSWYSID